MIARQHHQIVPFGRGGYNYVGHSRSMTPPAGEIGQCTGHFRCRSIERQDALPIEMQYGLQPFGELRGLPSCSLSSHLGDAIDHLRNRNR